jgi:hypothetical protein
MGLSHHLLDELVALKSSHALDGAKRVVEIGAQQLSNPFLRSLSALTEIFRLFGLQAPDLGGPIAAGFQGALELQSNEAPTSGPFWQALGFEYAAVDYSGEGDVRALDLNHDSVPQDWRGRFDLLINAGTTEHVVNHDNAFGVMHDLVKVGGFMIHEVPVAGFLTHGLVVYTMKFFWHLCRENGYGVMRLEMLPVGQSPLPQNVIDSNRKWGRLPPNDFEGELIRDWLIIASLRKLTDQPFVTPLDLPN